MASRTIRIIGVPSAAGAHSPGVEKAPQALRAAGLAEGLRRRGLKVDDARPDLPTTPFAIDLGNRRAQNVAHVVRVSLAVADEVEAALAAGATPLVLGGDCTILLGMLAGQLRSQPSSGLVYLDAHPDLNTPQSVVQGALDWMGMAHVLAVPGAVGELTTLGPRTPLLGWQDVVFFGIVGSELTEGERGFMSAHPDRFVAAAEIAGRAAAAAGEIADELSKGHASYVVHFDVDALDFVDLPIADNAYQRNQGLKFDDALAAVRELVQRPAFGGLLVTEVNPDHAPDNTVIETFVDGLAGALAA
jgi:arginase